MTEERKMLEETAYEVVSPIGEFTTPLVPIAPRLDTLNGKTICELSSNMYNAHVSFPIIRELLKKRYPDIKVIPYDEINEDLPGSTVMTLGGKIAVQEEKEQATIARMHKKGCDAVIAGNGG